MVIAQYRVRAGETDRVEEALRNMVAPTRAEPGNRDYQVFRDPNDPALFVLFERYADEDAFAAHRATPHFGTWLAGVVLPALEDRIRLDLVPLAGIERRPDPSVADGEALAFATRHELRSRKQAFTRMT
ncbi:MAG TPA: putative quinol monooxygenase [Trebonia sp.]